MLSFWIAFLFGVAQTGLTVLLTKSALGAEKKTAFFWFSVKIFAYVAGALIFVFRFLSKFMYILLGCAVGVSLAAVALFFYNVLLKKGEDD